VLARHFETLPKLMAASEEELRQLREVGPVMAESVAGYFRQARVRRLIEKFRRLGVDPKDAPRQKGPQPLAGKTVVFTGELKHFSRSEAERLARDLGGNATSSVSANTSFVVVGDNPGSKFQKAQKLGVEIIDENEFRKRIGQA
jgi:DNA ligase (NAD+)